MKYHPFSVSSLSLFISLCPSSQFSTLNKFQHQKYSNTWTLEPYNQVDINYFNTLIIQATSNNNSNRCTDFMRCASLDSTENRFVESERIQFHTQHWKINKLLFVSLNRTPSSKWHHGMLTQFWLMLHFIT